MAGLILDSIAVDAPDAVELSGFYSSLLEVENSGDFFYLPGGLIEIWFQEVDGYQPPTWPSQERGQQVHFDITVPDVDAAIARAVSLGATITERRNGYHYPILLDPVGHPFCLIAGAENSEANVSALSIDCDDPSALAEFYRNLIGGNIQRNAGWVNLLREGDLALSFQRADGYLPPTWPTQERGQQIHIDFHTNDRTADVQRAVELGATSLEMNKGFTVMLDPAGHPFCICDLND